MPKSRSVVFLIALTVPALLALALRRPPAQAPVTANDLTSALHWRSVGPFTGGRVTAVAGIPDQPNTFYMGTAGGGVWETNDYGTTWRNISDRDIKTGAIGAVAVAPSDSQVIYVGTGDSAPRNTVLTGAGMYKSTDGGRSWSFLGLADTHIISWILIDPHNPNVVYVAAFGHLFAPNPERGVYKTTDGGQTWKKILFVDDNTGAITLAMDPTNADVVYASMWQMSRSHWTFSSGGPGSGIYKTTDGGANWTNITHRPGLPTGIFGKVGLAVAPSDPQVVYALIQADYQGQAGGLFRSADGGQNWTLINNSMDITQRAFYYGYVYVDPKDANTIYLPNVGVYVSHDQGKTLTPLRPAHGDNHVFWINPNNPQIFIEGNDGGAGVTLNGGRNFSSEDNQPTGQFYHANLDQDFPFNIYGAQQDRSSVTGPSSGGPPVWTNVQGGEMSWVVPEPGQPWITYASGYYSMEWRDDRRNTLVTNVAPWPDYKFGLGGDLEKYRYGWIHHPVIFDPHNPKKLLMGANVLFQTLDEGIHWQVISPDLTRNDKSKQGRPGGPISADVTGEEMFDTISDIAFSPVADNIIWVGSDDGLVHLTTDGGANWQQVRPPQLPEWSTVTCIEPSHTDVGTAWVTASRFDWDDFHPYVYKTTDSGKTWTELTNGLPTDQYIESIRQDPGDPNLLFAATSETVYYSENGGRDWQPLTLNLPPVRVDDIEIQPQQHAVVLATFGRGFWVLDDLQFLERLGSAQAASQAAADAPYLFKPEQAWLASGGGRGGGGGFGGGGAESRPAGVTVFFKLPSSYSAGTPVALTFTTSSGATIDTISLPQRPAAGGRGEGGGGGGGGRGGRGGGAAALHPGVNRFQWNMRYPDAVEVKGLYHSGFSASVPIGPEVVPGTYYVSLSYNGQATPKQSFEIVLDPNFHTPQADLQQRFDLLMRIQNAITQLDTALNQAIDARDRLTQSGANSAALTRLNTDIDDLVDMRINSSEGGLVYPPKLRSWLSSIQSEVSMAYVAPTPAMVEVANDYINQAAAGARRLQADVAAAGSGGQNR